MKDLGFSPADILVPREGIDLEKWAVVACDQFTSDRSYWKKAEEFIKDAPSTLHITLPEVYLEDDDKKERITRIDRTMEKYLRDGVFRTLPSSFVLVERRTETGTRFGLVGKLDLEEYDYSPDSLSLIRATEGTILSRIPPRKEIRKNAVLEVPHIMVLISDPDRAVIERLRDKRDTLEIAYDTELMLGGGHLTGYIVSSDEDVSEVLSAIERIYSGLDRSNPLLFAMGDGNHSLATAKSSWEDIKKTLSEEERKDHPARYALVEIENIFDEGLMFEPIHRVFFGLSLDKFDNVLGRFCASIRKHDEADLDDAVKAINGKSGCFIVTDRSGRFTVYETEGTEKSLSAWIIQSVIDALLEENACRVDYIHGKDETIALAKEDGNIGIILPDIHKETFFEAILRDKAYPRKTFSIGHAEEKRYYMEARRIVR